VVLGAVTLGMLAGFVVRQARVANPILPLRLFRLRKVVGTNAVQALMTTAFYGFFFLGSLDLERVLGYGPLAIGLAFLPVAVVMGLFSVRFSAPLIARFGATTVLAAGQVVGVIALALVALGPVNASYPLHLLVPMALLGLGGGLSFPALTIIAMEDVPGPDAGLASGLLNTTGQVGGAFGLAVLATLAGARTLALFQSGVHQRPALADGYHLAWLVGAGLVLLSIGVGAWLRRAGSSSLNVEEQTAECEAAA
jgi:MFS family permease